MQSTHIQVKNEISRLIVEDGPTLVIHKERPSIIHAGIQGPRGIQGPVGIDLHYVHVQGTPSAVWTIAHNLNKKPAVSIVDSADTIVIGAITYVDENNLNIVFSAGFAGRAYLN